MTPNVAIQRPDLGTAFSQFPIWMAKGYVALQVFPTFVSPYRGGNYEVIRLEDMLRALPNLKRGPNGEYEKVQLGFNQDNFQTTESGLEYRLGDDTRKMYDYAFDAERYAIDHLMLMLAINLEIAAAAVAQSTANVAGNGAAAAKWNTGGSDPVADIQAAQVAFRAQCGFDPGLAKLVIDWELFKNLRKNASILDVIKYSGLEPVANRKITREVLAQVLDVDEVIVATGVKNTAGRGLTRSLSAIWDKTKALLFYPATGDISYPGFGQTILWGDDGASAEGTIEEYREESTRSQIFRARGEFTQKIKDINTGYLITGCL